MAERYDEQYRDRGYRRDDRGFMERAGDEVRSWFGDEDAERRRQYDDSRDRDRFRERQYGQAGSYSGQYDRSHDRSSSYPTGEQDWMRSHGSVGGGERGSRHAGPSYGSSYGSGYGSSYGSSYGSGSRENAGAGYGSSGSGGYGAGSGSSYGGSYGSGYNPGNAQGEGQRYGGGFSVRDDDRSSDWRRDLGGYRSEGRGGFAGRGPKGYQRSDERIREDVCDRLCENPDIDATEIEVSVNQGEVTVSGSVSDRGEKRRAEDLIEQVSGVREVRNNLRVARGQDATISGTGSAASGSAGSGAGGASINNPGITGGGPSGATDVSATSGSTPGSTLGLTGAPDKAATAGSGRR